MKKFGFATIIAVLFTTALFAADKKEVTIPADDGFSLKGTFYSAGKVGPGLLLLHQCNADRQIYDTLGTMLSVAGYNALTLDFRGFGGSRNAQYKDLAASRDIRYETRSPPVDRINCSLKALAIPLTVPDPE